MQRSGSAAWECQSYFGLGSRVLGFIGFRVVGCRAGHLKFAVLRKGYLTFAQFTIAVI